VYCTVESRRIASAARIQSTHAFFSFAVSKQSALLHHVYKFASEKQLNPPNQEKHFRIVKPDNRKKSYLYDGLSQKKNMLQNLRLDENENNT
jgi:hypothetical protein